VPYTSTVHRIRRVPDTRLAVAGALLLFVALVLFPFTPAIGRAILPAVFGASPALLALLAVLVSVARRVVPPAPAD
jgi:hypothetical protein